jgi:prolyl-tRNA editing enzyme YbaK/EbsC (Cys-tRNA(Pro) deacylase)
MTDAAPLSSAAQRVQDELVRLGFANVVIELPVPVRTAADAAREVNCDVAQIVKSLVFRGTSSGRGVLALTSGANRVDEAKLEALIGEPIGRADAKFVREHTGFAIGGIPPIAHATSMVTLIDDHLLALGTLWAAAGHPNSLFSLTPDELVRMSGGRVAPIAATPPAPAPGPA